jgi:hypothetical protein
MRAMSTSITELRQHREELKEDILTLLTQFQHNNDVKVTKLDLKTEVYGEMSGTPGTFIRDLKIDIEV